MAPPGNTYDRGQQKIAPAPPKPQSNAHYGTPGDNPSQAQNYQPGVPTKNP